MTRPALHPRWQGQRIVSPAIVWNTVMPALGVALILGAPIGPAVAVAAVAALVMHAVPALATQRGHRRRGSAPHRRMRHAQ
jgi:hypothetical protein